MLLLIEWLVFAAVTAQEFSVDLKALYDDQDSMTTKSWKKFYSEPPQTLETDAETDPHVFYYYKDVSQESPKTEYNSESSDVFGLWARHFDEPKILPEDELLLTQTLPADEDFNNKHTRTLTVSQDDLFKMISTPLPVGPSILEVLTKPMKCSKQWKAETEESGEEIINFIKSINQNPKGDAYDVFLSSLLSTKNIEPAPKKYQYHANEYGYGRKYRGLSIPNKPILIKRPTIKIKKIMTEDSRNTINENPIEDANYASFTFLPAISIEDALMQYDENKGYGERHQVVTVKPLLAPQATVTFKEYQGVTVISKLTQRTVIAVIKEYLTNSETVNYEAVLKFLSTLIMKDSIANFDEENKTTPKPVRVPQEKLNETAADKNVIVLQAPAESKRSQNMLYSLEALLKNRLLAPVAKKAKKIAPLNMAQKKKKKKVGWSQKQVFPNVTRLPRIVRYKNVVKKNEQKHTSKQRDKYKPVAPEKQLRLLRVKTKKTKEKGKASSLDLPALIGLIDNLTVDWSANLIEKLNKSMIEEMLPICSGPTKSDNVSNDEDFNDANLTGVLMGKCFVCGMDAPGMPCDTYCADAFSSGTMSMLPINPIAKSKIKIYRKKCRWKNIPGYAVESRDVWGRWTGGCSVRWIDISGMYTQRTCRNKHVPAMGKHWASKRMATLELALKNVNKGCIISPVASLVPMSRSISLYARFHACVCSGDWCNQASMYRQWLSSIVLISISTTLS